MSPATNEETIRASVEAVNRRDFDAAQALLHPDAELRNATGAVEGTVYRGDKLIEEWLTAIDEWAEDYRIELEKTSGEGEAYVVTFRNVARARGSGIPIDDRRYLAVHFKDGLIWRSQTCDTEEEARRMAGLAE